MDLQQLNQQLQLFQGFDGSNWRHSGTSQQQVPQQQQHELQQPNQQLPEGSLDSVQRWLEFGSRNTPTRDGP
jgi:hypothetical protein